MTHGSPVPYGEKVDRKANVHADGLHSGTDYFGVSHHSSGLYSYICIYIFAHD